MFLQASRDFSQSLNLSSMTNELSGISCPPMLSRELGSMWKYKQPSCISAKSLTMLINIKVDDDVRYKMNDV